MKKSLFLAICVFALCASGNVALAQSTPPPAYANCPSNDQNCWESAGGTQGTYYAAGHSAAESSAEGVRADSYATYYANQPYSEMNNDLNRYWNGYADAITNYNEHRYYGF